MRNFSIFVAVNVVGAIGWWLGSSFGMVTAVTLGGVGSLVGVWAGWHFHDRFLS